MRVPSYRLHRPSGKAVCTVNGRDVYLGVHGSKESKGAYRRLIAEYCSAAEPALFGRPIESLKIVEMVIMFLKVSKAKNGSRRNSEFCRQKLALKPLRDLYVDRSPSALSI